MGNPEPNPQRTEQLVTRFRIRRMTGPLPVQLWVISDLHYLYNPDQYSDRNVVTYGRRVIDLPPATWLAATWREAIQWAADGITPTPLEQVYPQIKIRDYSSLREPQRCRLCHKPEPREYCWAGKPEDRGEGICPLGYKPRWELEHR